MSLFASKELTDEDFLFFKEKIFTSSGIHLSDTKKSLIQSRLNAHLNQLNIKSFSDYRSHLQNLSKNDPENQEFINLLTTNKTDWFREAEHFNYLINTFIPRWKKLGKKTLKVWSAASSTGEEVYTLAVVIHKLLEKSGIDYQIVGSDIDTKVLGHAQNGVYSKMQLSNIPLQYHAFFDFGTGEIADWMKITRSVKSHVSFEQFNLKNDNYEKMNQSFDLIFCRNVMIYFTPEVISNIAHGCFKNTARDGVFITSHSESMQNIKIPWKVRQPSIYIKGQHFL